LTEHHNFGCKACFHQSYSIPLKQTKISTCSLPFFCPFIYNGQWIEKINFIQHLTKYKFFHLKKSKLSTHIVDFFGHVIYACRDVCANFTLMKPRSLDFFSSLVNIELPYSWHVQNTSHQKEHANLILHMK
jgi:hypothetical protein